MSEAVSETALEIRDVHLVYGRRHEARVPVLQGVNLSVTRGESVAIVGASGAGKSTLLNILGLLGGAGSGQVLVGGVDVSRARERVRTRIRATTTSFVFQGFHLAPDQSVRQNVEVGLACARVPRPFRGDRATAAIEAVQLGHRIDARAALLSGGEQQRVAIARALARRSPVILADEPTGNLDEETAAQVLHYLIDDRGSDTSLVIVTHDRNVAARADRVLELRGGRLHPSGLRREFAR